MDSYNIHFEKMSKFDLNPVSRHSPSKSTSSIDQYTHHHSKGDSAYSSFSGGSTAPDYPSPFLADDLHPHHLHYADLKYVKAVYGPSILDSNSNSISHVYPSMEADVHQNHQSHNRCSHFSNPDEPPTYLPLPPPPPPPPLTPPPPPPPPPPVHLQSFIPTRHLEHSVLSQSHELSGAFPFGHQASHSEIVGSKSEAVFNHLQLQTWQPKHLPQNMEQSSEIQHNRSPSACGVTVTEQQHTVNSWHMAQNTISGSIQHKGQFYFVTGVYKSSEPSVPLPPPPPPLPPPPPPQCVMDSIHTHTQAEKQRSYKTVEHMSKNVPLRKQSSSEIFFQEKTLPTPSSVEEPLSSHHFSQPQSLADLNVMNLDMSRSHTSNHPIFYCGPDENLSTSSQHKPVTTVITELDQNLHLKQDEAVNKLTRQALAEMPTEKISKETTPLLYHLTEASRASVKMSRNNEKNSTLGCKESDWSKDHQEAGRVSVSSSSQTLNSEVAQETKSNEFYYLCNTMDDSFKKYYKEKLKNAQNKVLRETSFKRKDLRLSWQNIIDQCCDTRLSVGPSQESTSLVHSPRLQNTEDFNHSGHKIKKETVKQQNIAQPQVPRVGGRKRLTLEQKKLSNSEPEQLNRLGDGPTHVTCRSLGSESEGLISEDCLDQQGLVAVRQKMFEARGRAMSACSISKNTLKHLQQNALVAYMERKTGGKKAEPQQPEPQVPSAGRLSDWAPKPYSGSMEKQIRPMSASRIQDSRCALFTSAQHSGHSERFSWKEQPSSPPSEKSASLDDLLEEQQQPDWDRRCSTSTTRSFYQMKNYLDSSKHDKDLSRVGIKAKEEKAVRTEEADLVPDRRRVRMVASRGKSMEELGMSVVSRPKVLSKSSDQLDQIQGSDVLSDRWKRDYSTQHCTPLIGCEGNPQIGPEHGFFKDPCSSEHTATVMNPRTRTSSVSGNEGRITAMSSFFRGANDGTSQMKTVIQEPYFIKSEASHGDVLSFGNTTDPSLWIFSSKMDEGKVNEDTTSFHTHNHHPQTTQPAVYSRTDNRKDSVSECKQSAAVPPSVAHDGDQKRKKKEGQKCPVDQLQWETLVQEVVSADQSLACILNPVANRKTAIMLMEQMLSEDNIFMGDHYKKKQERKMTTPEQRTSRLSAAPPAPPPAADDDDDDDDDVDDDDVNGSSTLNVDPKKRQLMTHIEAQLKSLEGLRSSLQVEEREIGLLGRSLEGLVRQHCLPAEVERYTQFIEDLERVISLLLCLSARLARVQNAMSTVDENMDSEEKESLVSRHHLLCKQREDAKDLKDNLDRRERLVSTFLTKQLTEEQLQEYRRFVQSKASLLIRQKDLEEKQRLGEEQLEALLNSIPP